MAKRQGMTGERPGGESKSTQDVMRGSRLPIANEEGVLHLHISSTQPEAAELKSHVEGMTSTNTDHHSHDEPVFNPSISGPQRRLMAMAEHDPGAVSKKNRGVLKMSHGQLHDFASTKGLKG